VAHPGYARAAQDASAASSWAGSFAGGGWGKREKDSGGCEMKNFIWLFGVLWEFIAIIIVAIAVVEKTPQLVLGSFCLYFIGKILTDIYGSNHKP
jgi:hypothetical protein